MGLQNENDGAVDKDFESKEDDKKDPVKVARKKRMKGEFFISFLLFWCGLLAATFGDEISLWDACRFHFRDSRQNPDFQICEKFGPDFQICENVRL